MCRNEDSCFMSSLIPFFRSIRGFQSLASALILFVFSENLGYSVAFLLLLAFSYSFNDIFDYMLGNDSQAHPNRPLPSGTLSLKSAAMGCTILAMLFLAQVVFISSLHEKLILISGLCISALYSLFLKRWYPGFAMPIWSAMTVVVFLKASDVETVCYVLCLMFFIGRELLLDIRDEKTDRLLAKTPSLATILGSWGRPIAVAGMIIPIMALLFFDQQNYLILSVAIALFAACLFVTYKSAEKMEIVTKAGYLFVFFAPSL